VGSLLVLTVAPFLVRRYVEPAIKPRAAVWIYLSILVAAVLMVLGVSVFLFLLLAPHSVIGGLGTVCHYGIYCPRSLPPWAQLGLWLSITALIGWLVAGMVGTGVAAMLAGRRIGRVALAGATPISAHGRYPAYEVADSAVFACTVGIWRPRIMVSRSLRESLRPEELGVVLAHEEAHAASRDNLVLLISRLAHKAIFFFPGMTQAYRGVRRSVEIAADASASAGAGDRLLVATSVSRVARLLFDSTRIRSFGGQPVAAAFAHGELVVERVQRLLKECPLVPSCRRLLCGVAVLAIVLAVFGTSLYTITGSTLTGNPASKACAEFTSR
jgi:Zn-dependent protease with chaperone function